jgi:DNA-binding response OmpR family regulator
MQEFLTTRPRVLVVGRTLMDALLRTGDRYDVLTAEDGPSGLEAARSQRPDLLLLNALLPGAGDCDGFSVCRTLKSQPLTRRIPVVLVTEQTSTEDRLRGMEAGADDFLAKPFNRLELLARVQRSTG